jgi:hypothetical protein
VYHAACRIWPIFDLVAELGDLGSQGFGFDLDRAAIDMVGAEILVFGAAPVSIEAATAQIVFFAPCLPRKRLNSAL